MRYKWWLFFTDTMCSELVTAVSVPDTRTCCWLSIEALSMCLQRSSHTQHITTHNHHQLIFITNLGPFVWLTSRQWVLDWDMCSICQPDNCDTFFSSSNCFCIHLIAQDDSLLWVHFCNIFWVLVVLAHAGGPVEASCLSKWVVCFWSVADELFWTCRII